MKTKKRVLTILCVLALMATSALAATGVTTKMIEAKYMGISIVVDGQTITPKDANGNVVEPFTYNDTTYLPVRAVGQALGKPVEWDGTTKTVYIGPRPQAGTGLGALPPYQKSSWVTLADGGVWTINYFKVAGKEQSVGLKFQLGYGDGNNYALWNLEGKYQTLTLTAGHVDDSSDSNGVIYFYLNGSSDAVSYDLNWEDLPKGITVPLNGAQSLKIVVSPQEAGSMRAAAYGLYDIQFS